VGQKPVVRTLMNAIKSDRIHHAYLMTGSRGIGKTSIARIFAKAVRCENTRWETDAQGQSWLMSCGECSSCKEIASGQGVDVIEIDGASNNGVDAVREIRENAKYLPSSGSKKIYVIDEVHMLTTAAFNALLKTLEEPPAHVIFILATTEAHKIPSTILSRCQRFDLKRITMAEIQTRLAEVAKHEKIEIESGALALLARAAEGSMRDALSLFDQVIAYAGSKISTEAVRDSIGLIGGSTVLGILSGIFARKPLESLKLVEDAYLAGHDLKLLGRNLIEFLHAAILAKVGSPSSGMLELSHEEWEELKTLAAGRSLEEIELFFQVFQNGVEWIARSAQPRAVLEVLVVKCASAEALFRVGTPASSAGPVSGGSSGNSGGGTPRPLTSGGGPAAPAPVSSASTADRPITFGGAYAQQKPVSASTPAVEEKATTPAYTGPKTWEAFIEFIRNRRPLLGSVLEHAYCENFPVSNDQEFVVCFRTDATYYQGQIASKAYLDQLHLLTKEFFGVSKRILVETKDSVVSLAQQREDERVRQEESAKHAVQNHPVIAEARSLFGGELGPIELLNPASEEGGSKRHESQPAP